MDQEFLQRLIKQRTQSFEEREVLRNKRQAIIDVAKESGREKLSDTEDAEFRTFTTDIKKIDSTIEGLDERIAEISEEIERSGSIRAGQEKAGAAKRLVERVNEQVTYVRGGPNSYFRDLAMRAMGMDNGEAAERLARHSVDVATAPEYNEYRTGINTTLGTGGAAVPPIYLMDQYVLFARAGRPFADAVPNEALPAGTNSINIPKITAGTATAWQTSQNSLVQETDLTDAYVTAPVWTIAGQQTLSRQLIDQSPVAFDQIVFRDLIAAHAAYLDAALWTGSGSGSAQVLGVNNTSGIGTIAVSNLGIGYVYGAIAQAIQQIHTQRFLPPDVIFMHPRRWGWFTQVLDTTNRPLVIPRENGVFQAAGVLEKVDSQQVVGSIQGLPVVTDPNIPTNLGAGNNQDAIYVMRSSDMILYESGVRAEVFPQTYANNLSVLLQISNYVAFTAARYPQSIVEITGFVPTGWGGS